MTCPVTIPACRLARKRMVSAISSGWISLPMGIRGRTAASRSSSIQPVNCVAPGPTQTGWIDEDLEAAVLPLIPMGQLIQPEDIAETILFLASRQARMLTGQVIKVSGGHAL